MPGAGNCEGQTGHDGITTASMTEVIGGLRILQCNCAFIRDWVRFEEAYGDAGNLRGRYPLAAVGFLSVQRASILTQEPETFERTIDMMRKLRDTGDGNGYTVTALVLAERDDPPGSGTAVRIREHEVPEDVASPQFFSALVRQVLAAAPVVHHVAVRESSERRNIPIREEGRGTTDLAP